MTRHIRFQARYVAALAPFVCREEHRYYLGGIYVEPHPSQPGVLLVATDGHTMAVVHDETGIADGPSNCSLSKRFIAACKIHSRVVDDENRARGTAGEVHLVGDAAYVTAESFRPEEGCDWRDPTQIGPDHLFAGFLPPIDGTFPDWRAVLPRTAAAPAPFLSVNPALLARFEQVARLLAGYPGASMVVYLTGEASCAVIRLSAVPNFLGLLMPMRANDDLRDPNRAANPDWLKAAELQQLAPEPTPAAAE